jgi:FG-GAP-like repeat/FG-GAP repeat
MAHAPGKQSRNRHKIFTERRRNPVRGRELRSRSPNLEVLESRTLLAVTPTLGANGILTIALTASNDAATISEPNTSTIRVFDGSTNRDFARASVSSIAAAGNNSSNQSVTFNSSVNLTGPLSATGLTSEVLNGSYQVRSASLTASGTIDIAAGSTLSTRRIAAGGDPLTAPSVGNSGAIGLTAPNIQVGNGANVLANADSGFTAADVTMSAHDEADLNFLLGLAGFQNAQSSASITIGAATIKAKDVNVTALSSTTKTVDLTQNLNDSRTTLMADLTGNGLLDLVVGNYNGPVEIYLNNGTTDPFNNVTPILLTNSDPTVGLAAADVNHDGRADLIVANQGAPTRLYLNNGSATNPFGGVTPIAITNANATSVALADVNGDSRPDLVVGAMSTDPTKLAPSQLFLNTGSTTKPFGPSPILITGADYVTSLAVIDLNGDKRPDLVVGQAGNTSGGTTFGEPTRVFMNTGIVANPFGGAPLNVGATDLTTTAVAAADMNGDGHPDLVIGHNGAPTQLFLNTGNTSNPFGAATPRNITGSEATTTLAAIDANGDGHPDLVVGNSGVPTQLFLNNGSTTTPFAGVTAKNVTAAGDDTRSVTLGDLDGDGRPDLLVDLNGDFPRVYLNNKTATPFKKVADTINPAQELSYQANESAVLPFNLAVAAVLAQAKTEIAIGSGATINAAANVTLNSQAISSAQATVLGVFLGGGYADSEPTSNVSIGSGANITAGGVFDLESLTQNTVSLLTIVPTLASPGTVSFSYEKARSSSTADISAGATVTAGAATIHAQNNNHFSNSAKSLGLQASGPASLGVAVAISDVQSGATASVNGSVHTTNDTTIDAQSINTNNTTSAIAAIIDPLQNKPVVGGAITSLGKALSGISFTNQIGNSIINGAGEHTGVAVSAGVTVARSINTANAFVGSHGVVSAGGNVTVNARAEDNFKSNAAGTAGEGENASVGGGVDYSQTTNHANAYLDAGATVDAGLLLHVVADADIPNPVQLFGVTFSPPADNTGTNNSNGTDRVNSGYATGPATAESVLSYLEGLEQYVTTVLTGRLGSVATSYAQSGGEVEEDATIGIAGDVNIFSVDNSSNAYIGRGALVNQHTSTPHQDVQVESDTNIETINLAGQAELLNALELFGGAAGGKAGIGGSFEDLTFNNAAHAYIDANARVSAGRDINVNANTFNYALNLAQGGANSEALGVSGVVSFFNLNNDTEGWIDAGATINAGRDVKVTAGNTLTDIVATGGIALGGDVGVGVSGSFNNLTDTTKAYIGVTSNTAGTLGSVTAGHNITVHAASSQKIVSVGISGAFSAGESPPTSTNSSGNPDPTAGIAVPASISQQPAVSGKEFGIGVSGDVGLNFLSETTEAFINGTGTITAGNALAVTAADTALFIGAAGGVAFGNHVGIGGSVALDNLSTTTEAFTQNAKILAGSIDVSANSSALVVSVAGGGAGSAETAAVAGSVNLNFLASHTEAYLGDGTTATTTKGGVTVDAVNSLNTVTVAGALAVTGGSLAVGGALDLGIYDPTVLSYISGSATVTAAGDVQVDATSSETIRSVGAALALALEDGVGASGSAAAQVLTDIVQAYIGSGAVVNATGSVFIDANDDTDLLAIAGSVAGGAAAGVGISAGVGLLSRTVKAFIGSGANVSALGNGAAFSDPEGSGLTGTGVVIDATTEDENLVFAAGVGVGVAEAGLAASAVVNTETSDTESYIGQSAKVSTPKSIQVHAEEDTNNITVAGAFGGSSQLGVGAAADVHNLNRTVKAHIDASANVSAGANVVLSADAPETIIAVAAGLGVGGDVAGIAGSATVFTLMNDTEAFIANRATVAATGSISLSALSDRTFVPTAGALALSVGEGGAIGASDSTLVAHDTTLAFIGANALITALGSNTVAPVSVLIGQKNSSGDEQTTTVHGVSLAAVSFLRAIPVTAGGAGGLIAGVAGAANVDNLTEVTQAYISQSTKVNATNTGAGPAQDVDLLASDQTTIGSGAGALTGGGGAGIGAGADVAVISKNTVAYIDASVTVNATEHVKVNALSHEQMVSTSASASGGGVGIAGATAVYVLTLNTDAYIGAAADIEAGGNVVVTANDDTNLLMIAGDLSFGGAVGVGGSVALPVITKSTMAYVDQNATINALGQKGASNVNDGQYNVSFSGAAQGAPAINSNLQAATVAAFTKNRTATAATKNVRGVAIVATSTDHLTTVAAAGGGGGAVGVNIAASAVVPKTTTDAFIGAGAHVDQSAANSTSANAAQSVLVAAGADYYHLGVAGELSGSGGVSVDPGAELTIASNNTAAYVDSSAQVAARRDVQVVARQGGAIVSFAGGLSVGSAAVAGSVSVFSLNDQTLAYIGAAAKVNAGGNVQIAAQDDTGSSMIDGTVALGFDTVGVGGSLALNLITKDTEAYVGAGATVNASAQNSTAMTVFQSGVGFGGSFSTTTANGVAVQAESSEGVFTTAASGAGGAFGALAGAVTVNIIGATTKAYIGAGALVNQNLTGAAASQSVNVAAADSAILRGIDGALAGTNVAFLAGALAGGVDVGIIRNTTSAYVDNNARVHANGNVNVFALNYKSGDSLAISAAVGNIGIAGSVSVYSIDAGVSSDALSSLTAHNAGNSSTAGGYSDSQANASAITSQLGGYARMGSDQSSLLVKQAVSAAQSALKGAAPNSQTSTTLNASVPPTGTSAYIGSSAVVSAGGALDLDATELDALRVIAGGGTLGVGTIGGSVALVNVGSQTQAFIANGAAVFAIGNLIVHSGYNLVPLNGLMASAYGGNAGLVASLGAQVAIVNDSSVQSAHIGETSAFGAAPASNSAGMQILQAGQVTVSAGGTRSLTATAAGGTFSVGLAAGAAVAEANERGASRAYLGDYTQVGQGIGPVASLTISNSVTTQAVAQSTAIAAGIGAGSANVANAENTPAIQASIGSNSRVLVGQGVTISAGSQSQSSAAISGVQVGGIAVGVSLADATMSPIVNSFIGSGANVVSTSGGIAVRAVQLAGGEGALATGSSSGISVGTGEGANITANAGAQVSSYIGNNATVSAPGNVAISATGNNIAQTVADSLAIGLGLEIGAIFATSKAHGVDSAYLGDGAVVGTAAMKAGGLNVTATGLDTSTATVDLSGGGIFAGNGGNATTTTSPTLNAYLGNNSTVIVTGDITVESTSTTEGDANATGASGGIVDVNESLANASVTPTINTYIGSSAKLIAGGNITVESLHGATGAQLSTGDFTPANVNTTTNTITLSQDEGLQTGDIVTYAQNSNPPIGGLTDGSAYPVIVVNPNTVQLGASFDGAGVNPTNDTINFANPHNLENGERVVYEDNGNTPIGGLKSGSVYVVYVIDEDTIKLEPDGQIAPPPITTFDPSASVTGNTFNFGGFSNGQAVTYRAPAPLGIAPQEISDSTINLGVDPNGTDIPDGFTNGEGVIYNPASGATTIGGLTPGKTYFVIAVADNAFQLSSSVKNGVPGGPITLTVPDDATGLQLFSAVNQQPIRGLTDGNTYYVVGATALSFQLSATPGGKAISLNVSKSSGEHTIAVEGIDFTSAGTGTQSLVLQLNPAGASGTYQLVGGASVHFASKGEHDASATAIGSGGGAVQIGGADAEVTSSPTVDTFVGDDADITAGGDIAITSTSFANTDADGTNTGGGFVAVGGGTANVRIVHKNSATVGDRAKIQAQGNFTLQAASLNHVVNASSDSSGGGFVQIASANTTVNVVPETLVEVGASAQITAAHSLQVDSQTDTVANSVYATTTGGGVGAQSESSAKVYIGKLADAYSQTTIDTGAALLARETTIQAVTSYELLPYATASAKAFGAKTVATSVADANDSSHVTIMTGATITGTNSVDIEALHDDLEVIAYAFSNCAAAFGQAFANTESTLVGPSSLDPSQPDMSQVDAEPGATITTPILRVKALATFAIEELAPDAHGGFIVGHYNKRAGQVVANRTIQWNSDVVSGGGTATGPTLIVNADGSVNPSSNITPTVTATQIIVPNITNSGPAGSITFEANEISRVRDGDKSDHGLLFGDQATFFYTSTLGDVQLLNNSRKDLVVNDIGLAGNGGITPNVEINVFNDVSLVNGHFAFDVVQGTAPTSVDIENRSTTGSPNIILSGFINNPIGATTILNARGNIQSAGQRAVVLTNILDVEAPKGQIGAISNFFNIDLVQSESANKVQRPIHATVLAGGNAYLNVRGFLRDPDFNLNTTQFIVPVSSIHAGGDIVAILQNVDRESAPGSANAGITVFENYTNLTTLVTTHFRPGSGAGPAASDDPGFFDSNDTLIDGTYSFGDLKSGGNITLIGDPTSTTIDGKLVTPHINITGFVNLNPSPSAIGQIGASTTGDIALTETKGAMRVSNITAIDGDIILAVPHNAASGNNFLMTSGSTINAVQGSVRINVADNVTIPSGSSITATFIALIQGDYGKLAGLAGSIINVSGQIFAPIANINGGADNDAISLTNVPTGTVMTVNTGGGVNTVNVGSIPPPEPNKGILGNVQGPLTVKGNGNDTLNVDGTGATIARSGALTATALTGLNMGAKGITYSGLANLNIYLGSGGNTFLIANTAAATNTFLNSGKGADTVNVRATTGPTTVNTGGGANKNIVNVGSLEPAVGGFIGPIKGALIVAGNGHDTMNVDDTGSTVAKTGTLTGTTLTGLNMGPSGITYGGLSILNISLGSGVNTFTVANTATGATTTLNSGAGKDTVNITTTSSRLTVNTQAGTDTVNVHGIGAVATINAGGGNDAINVSSNAPTNTGALSGITAALTVNGGTGSTTTNVSDTGDTTPSTSTLTPTKLTSTAFGAAGSLSYSSLAALNISMGSGGNTFNITNTAAATTTTVRSGAGSDTINVQATGGPTTLQTGGGSNLNTVNVGSKAPAAGGVLNNIQGALTVIGNSADTMNLDDTGTTVAKTGVLTATAVTGLNPATDGIVYSGLAKLIINLGKAAGEFDVKSSVSGTTSTIVTQAAGNVWNVGSNAPTLSGGVLSGIQGPVVIDGGGSRAALTDTINFDDSGSKSTSEYGALTDNSLTRLGMGPGGVTFVGQAVLNIKLGNNGTVLQGFIANNLPATTNITGGSSNSDSFISGWGHDFNGTLNLSHIGDIEVDVNEQFYGHLNATAPASIDSLIVGGSVNAGSSISAQQIESLFIGVNLDINLTLPGIAGAPAGTDALGDATIGGSLPEGITLTAASIGPLAVGTNGALAAGSHNLAGIVSVTPGDLSSLTVGADGSIMTTAQVNVAGNLGAVTMLGATPNVGQVMAGVIDVGGTLGSATIAGGTPGLFIAGRVGTIGADGGFGPIVLRVIEAGVQRWLEEDPAGQVFSQPDASATATTPGNPTYINTQYLYESAGFSSPQISARITNGKSTSPDQFDLSTVVFQDGASFNLDRLDASGVSGIRNVAVEGSLVTTLSPAASNFFRLPDGSPDPSPAGVYLPADDLASVSVRDYAPNDSIIAAEIQGVAFGSFMSAGGAIEPGSQANNTDASSLLGPGTTIVPAGSVSGQGAETFRVPFAALPGQQSAFFLDTASAGGIFDPNLMEFALQSDSDGIHPATLFPATRGAVTAMIGVDLTPQLSVVQSVDLYGDGGSILSGQFIAQAITSTGPLGDLTVLAPQGLNNVTAPSIFGNIAAAGPLFGTIQTTGLRTDPVTGATSVVAPDLGRVYVSKSGGRSGQPSVTATTIGGQGSNSLTGRIISRGNLISSIRSDDGGSGLVAAKGDLGALTSLLGTPTRVGGLLINGGFSGQLVVLGNAYGDLTFHGGLNGGRVAVKGTGGAQSGILGNVIVDRGFYPTGSIGAGSAIVSDGEIGDASFGTALSVTDSNDGIVAAIGSIRQVNGPVGGYVFNNLGATPGDTSAAAIDAIFTDGGQPLGLDLPNQPLASLAVVLEDLAALHVDSNGKLTGPKR